MSIGGQYRSRYTSIAARCGFVPVLRVECAGLLFVWTVLQNLSNNQLILLRCISPKVARNGPPAMSAVWSLSGGKRTWRLRAPTSEFDPNVWSGRALQVVSPSWRGAVSHQ